jgi:hypothetical protein
MDLLWTPYMDLQTYRSPMDHLCAVCRVEVNVDPLWSPYGPLKLMDHPMGHL